MKGLGRGLDALLAKDEDAGGDTLKTLKLDALPPGKYQPRTRMEQASLEERARENRLHHALRIERARQLLERRLVHARTRRVFARLKRVELQGFQSIAAGVL